MAEQPARFNAKSPSVLKPAWTAAGHRLPFEAERQALR